MVIREELAALPGGYTVARADATDIPAIVAMLVDDGIGKTREEDPSDPRYRNAFDAIVADPRQTLVVVLDPQSQVCGTLQLTTIPGLSRRGTTRVIVEAVRIAGRLRGTGVGTAVMQWVIAYSTELGASLLQLTTDHRRVDAHRFYARLGFVGSHLGMKMELDPEPKN